jgi:hypothetical protein
LTEDARLEYRVRGFHDVDSPEVSEGRAAIMSRVGKSHSSRSFRRRHQMTNIFISRVAPDVILASCQLTLWELYVGRPALMLALGAYEDQITFIDGVPHFKSRSIMLENNPQTTFPDAHADQ